MARIDVHNLTRAAFISVAAIFLAALCWISAADRIAATSNHVQKVYFGGSSAAHLAFQELARNHPPAALKDAEWAVRTAPLDPSTTSALGSSSLALGQPDRAYAAFVVAGGLGWRDIPTQLYWLSQAATIGDVDVVTQRLDALLRLDIDNDLVANSLNLLERTKSGRMALAKLLSEDPPWEHRFLAETSKLEGSDFYGRLTAIDLAAAKGAAIDCDAVGGAASQMIAHGRAVDAKALWRGACDRTGGIYLSDGSFENEAAQLSNNPFGWRLQPRGGLDADIAPATAPLEGQALKIGSSLTVRTVAARQYTVLQPGNYRMSWKTALNDGKPDSSIGMLVRCEGTAPAMIVENTVSSVDANQAVATFSIPAYGCVVQEIDIQKAASVSGETQTGWIDDIDIVPLHPGG